MKSVLSEKTIFYISIIGLLLSLFINVFSIYNLSKNVLPTLYIFIFGYSLFTLVGISYYLLESKIGGEKEDKLNNFFIPNSQKLDKVLQISFYVVITLILIILSKSLYIKPLLYYLLVSIATVIIGLQIISKHEPDKKRDYAILFLQIIPLATIIAGSSFLINPYLIGPDVPWHFHFIQKIIENGYLSPSASYYYYYPSYHLIQSVSGILLGFSESSFNLINLGTSVVSIIIAYLMGREIFKSGKVGLMCSLLLSTATMHIFFITYNTSKIGGTALLLLCLLFIIRLYKSRNIKIVMLFWVSTVPLFFWHPEISITLLVVLCANFVAHVFIRKKLYFNAAIMLYLVAYIAYLVYVDASLFTRIIQHIFIEKSSPLMIQSFASQTITTGFLFQTFIAYLGITIPVFFAVYIGLKWLNKLNKINLFILSLLILIHILPVTAIFSGNYGLFPARTLAYVSILLIIVTAGGIFEIFKFRKKSSVALFAVMLLLFSFFSVSSYLIGDGNEVFNDQIPIQTMYTTESNLASHNFLNKTSVGSMYVSKIDNLWGEEIIEYTGNHDSLYNNGDFIIFKS